MMHPDDPTRELSRQTLAAGEFLSLQAIHWRDAHGHERIWETADRSGGTHAVMLIAWLVPSQRLVLIRQYRPPAKGFVIEFPAGIMAPGERPEQAALRELYEETGYGGRVIAVHSPAFNTPGLSSDAAHPVLIEIDENDPANANPSPHLQDDEELDVMLVDRQGLRAWLAEQEAHHEQLDGKVLAYVLGLTWGSMNSA